MPKEEVDEYLEAIYDIAGERGCARTGDVAQRLGVAPASATEVLQRLSRARLVRYEAYKGVTLTRKGLRSATKLKRKHRLLEVFLHDVLGLKGKAVHEEACKMEHAISDETEAALCLALDKPATCPHGSPIPECTAGAPLCQECGKSKTKEGLPLTDLHAGQSGKIKCVRGGRDVCQRLADMGLVPGTAVSVLRVAPMKGPIELCVRGCNLVLGRGIADKVFVQCEREG
ncbi:MAG: metal-dependent transcriptional regulator [Euryarchaeota archaeon]|nr:metal-dependent transcriptional regulator [Euryarchaeota archaeon]